MRSSYLTAGSDGGPGHCPKSICEKSRADRSPGSAMEHTLVREQTQNIDRTHVRADDRGYTAPASGMGHGAHADAAQHMRAAHDTPTPSLTHQIAHDDHTRPPTRSHKTANERGRSRAHILSLSLPVWPWSRHTSVTHTGATHMTAAHRGPPGQSPLHEPRHAVRWPGRCACPETARIWRPPRSLSLHAHDTTTLSHSCLTRLASGDSHVAMAHGSSVPHRPFLAPPAPREARGAGRDMWYSHASPYRAGMCPTLRVLGLQGPSPGMPPRLQPARCHRYGRIVYVYTMVSSPRSRRQVAEIASRSRGRRAA
jgi:hypothetical protein